MAQSSLFGMTRGLATCLFAVFATNAAMAKTIATAEKCGHAADQTGTLLQIHVGVGDGRVSPQIGINCARDLAMQNPSIRQVRISLDPGEYRLNQTLVFDGAWVGGGRKIEFVAEGGAVSISGSEIFPSGSANTDAVSPLVTRYAVPLGLARSEQLTDSLKAWLPEHGQRYPVAPQELIVNGKIYQWARWPDVGFLNAEQISANDHVIDHKAALPNIKMPDVLAHGYWHYDWADARVRLKSSDLDNGFTSLASRVPKYGLGKSLRFYLYGHQEFLTEKGEYAFDTTRGLLLFLSSDQPKKVELTNLESLIKITGATNFLLRGIEFNGARGTAIDASGSNISIEDVVVANVGGVGIRLGGESNQIFRSEIRDTGHSGVEIYGGDRMTLSPAHSRISESVIERFGRLIGSSVPGVRIDGVGIEVSNNTIRHGPHAGIFYFGNDHLIADNEVYDVARTTGDVGAIYTGRDWTGRGHRVVRNYVHDVKGVGRHGATAFYLDDQASGVEIKDNVAWRVWRGLLLGGGRDNVVRHNIILATKESMKFDARGMTWQAREAMPDGVLRRRLSSVPYAGVDYRAKYPKLAMEALEEPGTPRGNDVSENIFIGRLAVESLARQNNPLGGNWLEGNPGLPTDVFEMFGSPPGRSEFDVDWSLIEISVESMQEQIK